MDFYDLADEESKADYMSGLIASGITVFGPVITNECDYRCRRLVSRALGRPEVIGTHYGETTHRSSILNSFSITYT